YSFCEDNPNVCQNNGTCINAGSSYICQCKSEYRGVNCTIEKVTCKSGLGCLNQGTCTKVNGKYACMCPPLFTGKFCEFNTGICKADTCRNGGTCVVFGSTRYTCKCEKDFKGAFCEQKYEDDARTGEVSGNNIPAHNMRSYKQDIEDKNNSTTCTLIFSLMFSIFHHAKKLTILFIKFGQLFQRRIEHAAIEDCE
ncbi:conserved hypothetical protein, partial [Trichinella spiralis]|uniref:hypothetical protein n=1 Tax=Trichinella spiralis TaxID=6334 RepID=UPI0001EFD216